MQRTQPFLNWFLAAVVLAEAIFGLRQLLDLSDLRAALSALDRSSSGKRLDEAEQKLALARSKAAEAAQKTKPRTKTNATAKPANPGASKALANAMNDPDFAKLLTEYQKLLMSGRYGTLFKLLGLSADPIDRFKLLLAQRQQAKSQALAAIDDQGINDPAARKAFMDQAQIAVSSQMQDLLGPQGYASYQYYEASEYIRQVVQHLAEAVNESGAPLADGQTEQLVRLWYDTNNRQGLDNTGITVEQALGWTPITPIAYAPDKVMTAFQNALSGPQFEVFSEIRNERQAERILNSYQR